MTSPVNPRRARIIATGSCIPDFVLTNEALTRMVDTSDEWIRERTGIEERRINTASTNREMASLAARRAIGQAGIDPASIDAILCSTVTNDNFTPALACYIQADIGAFNAFAFDLNAGCSGFVYALELAASLIAAVRPGTRPVSRVLVVSSEMLSAITDYSDRASCVLFGDSAGAVILDADETGLLASVLRCDGSGADSIVAPALTHVRAEDGCVANPESLPAHGMKMNGREVYRFAVKAVPDTLNAVLAEAGMSAGELKYVVLHQANLRIINAAIDRLGIDSDKVPVSITRYGNSSSACIPVLLDELNRAGNLQKGDKIAVVGFGSGLTSGAAVLEW